MKTPLNEATVWFTVRYPPEATTVPDIGTTTPGRKPDAAAVVYTFMLLPCVPGGSGLPPFAFCQARIAAEVKSNVCRTSAYHPPPF